MRNIVAKLSTFWSLSSPSTAMLNPMNHSPARTVKGVPYTAWLTPSAISAVMANSAATGL
jgi:hypothetical protein